MVQTFLDFAFCPCFQGLTQKGKRYQHGGRVKIEMNTSVEEIDGAVHICGKSAGCYERLHTKRGRPDPRPGPLVNLTASVEKNDARHDENRKGEFLDGPLRELCEKTGIEGKRKHHHVQRQKGGYSQAYEFPLFFL